MTALDRTDVLIGPLRIPRNAAQSQKGSIHDDETAQRLGMRGGTVAGSIHLDLFPPLLLDVFGQRWYDRGSVSVNFKNATVDREPTRAYVTRPADADAGASPRDVQVRVWIEREDQLLVGEGTASVGDPAEPSALRAIDHNRYNDGEFRILEGIAPGDAIPRTEVTIDGARQQRLLENRLVTEPLDWYSGESPWGGPIAAPQSSVHDLYTFAANHIGRTVRERGGGVGLFGAIELRNLRGPLLLDTTYAMDGTVLGVGQSPKTEYVWFETTAHDPRTDDPVAGLIMQLRWMKASSPLYT